MKNLFGLFITALFLTACSSDGDKVVPPEYQGIWVSEFEAEAVSSLSINTAARDCERFWDGEEHILTPIEVHQSGLVSMMIVDAYGPVFLGSDAPFGYISEEFGFELSDFVASESADFRGLNMEGVEFEGPGYGNAALTFSGYGPFNTSVSMSYMQTTEEELDMFNDLLSTFCR